MLILLCLFTAARPAVAQDAGADSTAYLSMLRSFEGDWSGAFVREGAIQPTQFRFELNGDSLQGLHHIPERALFGEPVRDISLSGDTLYFRSRYGLFWALKRRQPEQIMGLSVGWNPKIKLHLKRSSTPFPEFPFERFVARNGDLELAGRLYLPAPQLMKEVVIVLVHGSGPVTMDERYYRSEALALAERGYHVAVYDKRGNGNSGGSMEGATLQDFAADARTIMQWAREQYGERMQYGFLGISQGGWIGTLAASESPEADFLILNVGPAVSVWQQELDRVRFSMRQQDYEDQQVERALDHVRLMFDLVGDSTRWEEYLVSSRKIADMGLEELVNTATEVNDRHVSWWRANKYDPAEELAALHLPVLSLLGGSDALVPPETNRGPMQRYLQRSGAPFYEIHVLEGAHHNLQVYASFRGERWDWPDGYWVWQHKAEDLYKIIDAFLEKVSSES